jgi:hypothetical protein
MTQGSEKKSDNPDGCNKPAYKDQQIAASIDSIRAAYVSSQDENSKHQRGVFTWTKAAAGGVFVYTLLTLILVGLTYCSLQETRRSVVASTRAWIGPSAKPTIDGFSAQAATTYVHINYKNVGKEPGVNFQESFIDDWTATLTAPYNKNKLLNLSSECSADGDNAIATDRSCKTRIEGWIKDHCDSLTGQEQRVAFPDFEYDSQKEIAAGAERRGSNKVLFVQGCFAYKSRITGDEIHRSAFCFFKNLEPNSGGDVMRPCSVGNTAN